MSGDRLRGFAESHAPYCDRTLKLALALQIGFLRMTGRLLEAVRSVPPALIGRIAPTRTEGINLHGVFSFPIDQYAEQLLPTTVATKSRAVGA